MNEQQCLTLIEKPLPKSEIFNSLLDKKIRGEISEAEKAELLEVCLIREDANADRAEAVFQLSQLRKVPFSQLWLELVGPPSSPVVI